VANCISSALHRLSFNATEGGPAIVTGSYTLTSDSGGSTPPSTPGPYNPLFQITPDPREVARATPPPPEATHRAGTETWRTEGEPALEKLRKSAVDAPAIRKHREALVRGLLLRGRFPDALKEAEAFSLSDPDNASAIELIAYAAAVNGDAKKSLAAVDALVESDPSNRAAHLRAAQALEASGDEIRACAHWRSAASLGSRSEDISAEAFRCRARALGEREIVLAELNAMTNAGPKLKKLIELIPGDIPKYDPGSTPGAMEVQVTCDAEPCPTVAIVSPSGTIFSPWTPSAARSSAKSVAVSSTGSGVYRTVLVGPVDRSGSVKIRAFGVEKVFAFTKDGAPTIAETTITEPIWGGLLSAMLWGLPADSCGCMLR
jgi:Ca-activated chloride channel family protein